ncbi:DUF58 domain-containing protein [Halomarina salina]|uniref:DUF58 domain-containing protein n=1 Tax=Halomarina salina TaxID=1872699 RepID=A0ABD5RT98_9EURY|nr:DUF58 domain-containing protein [Halomarina salina]
MHLTRRGWATIGLVGGLAAFAVILRSWLLFAGTALLGAWLLARAVLFVTALSTFDDALTVRQSIPSAVRPDTETPVTLSATIERPTALTSSITLQPPVVAETPSQGQQRIELSDTHRDAATTVTVRLSVAGVATFDCPHIVVTDGDLFWESITRGERRRIQVQPRVPDDIHIGQGGQEIASGYGEHEAIRPSGGGVEPESIREYVPTDSVRQIDWKATARTQTTQVREYQAETDRDSMLLVDHRGSTVVGQPGETAQEFIREVALAIVEKADTVDDPVGCFTVGDAGITGRFPVSASESGYNRIRRHLTTLTPTEPTALDDTALDSSQERRSPAAARRAATTLSASTTNSDQFAQLLAPYFEASERYVERIGQDPLFAAARRAAKSVTHTVIFTTDSNRSEIRETVKLARQADSLVTVFLAPRTLFESGGLADLGSAYDSYLEFEEFRRSLAGLDRVEAYEIAPGARLAAVLDSRRSRRGRTA